MTGQLPLQTKLVRYIIIAMTFCGLLFGTLSLSFQYIFLVNDIKTKTYELANSQIPSLAFNLFSYNDVGTELIVSSIENQEFIKTVEVLQLDEEMLKQPNTYAIVYKGELGEETLGVLKVIPQLKYAFTTLKQSAWTLMLSIFLMIVTLGVFSVWLFRFLVMRHLLDLVEQIHQSKPGEIGLFKFNRKTPKEPDELQRVIDGFNELHSELNHSIRDKENANFELNNYKVDLELKVRERTIELEQANEIVLKTSKAKSDFMSNMSHEIRTPANAIVGLTELILRMELGEEQKQYVNKIKLSTKNLLRVINEILDYAKIESGKVEIEKIEFDLQNLLMESANIFSQECKSKGLYLHLETNWYGEMLVKSDPTRISQVLNNFLSNALKFTKQGGINVVLEINGDWMCINVIDTGMGVDKKVMSNLFQPFVQADSSITRQFGGTGLGLTICKNYIELMGGKVSVISEKGKGSNFNFIIPFEPTQEEEAQPDIGFSENKSVALLSHNDILIKHIKLLSEKINIECVVYQNIADIDYDVHFALLYEEGEVTEDFECPINCDCIVDHSLQWSHFQLPMSSKCFYDGLKELSDPTSHKKEDAEIVINQYPGKRVLLVEDNFLNQEVARAMLEQSGIEVESAYDGKEGVELASNGTHYDLILMDIQMPVMGGVQALKVIQQTKDVNEIPIVAFTALNSESELAEFKKEGFFGHIPKPFEPEELFAILDEFIK